MSRKPKEATRERIATMLDRAIEGSERLGMSDVADGYRQMDVDSYAAAKGIAIIENPASEQIQSNLRSEKQMSTTATADTRTKQQLIDSEAELLDLLDEIWNLHVDLDESSPNDKLVDASDETCDILHEYDPERFPIDDEEEEGDEEGEGEEGGD